MTERVVDEVPDEAPAPKPRRRTQKYRTRQAAIVHATVPLINTKGVRGTTVADVAARLGVVPTAVMYYFRTKEELAAACFREALDVYEGLIRDAQSGETPLARLRSFVLGYVGLMRDIARGKRQPIAVFNDVRALGDREIIAAFECMFRGVRGLLGALPPRGPKRQALNAVTHLMISQLFWSVVWLPYYAPDDYARVAVRMFDILERGLCAPGRSCENVPSLELPTLASNEDAARETFLRAATQIINEHGYLGASVERISASLNVTKGSFYHHIDAKDDLVVACFQRTLDVMRGAQRLAAERAQDGWGQLCGAVTALVGCQVSGQIPLLRTSALTSSPGTVRAGLVDQFGRVSLTFAAMISDGAADGSVRSVDAHVAAQMVTAMINAAAELANWTPGLSPALATEAYVGALLTGVGTALPPS